MLDIWIAARKIVVNLIIKGMEEEKITKVDGQKFHDWTNIRRNLELHKEKRYANIKKKCTQTSLLADGMNLSLKFVI